MLRISKTKILFSLSSRFENNLHNVCIPSLSDLSSTGHITPSLTLILAVLDSFISLLPSDFYQTMKKDIPSSNNIKECQMVDN